LKLGAYTQFWVLSGVLGKLEQISRDKPGNTKGESITVPPVWFGISCMTTDIFCFYLQNRLIQTSQIGGQRYSDTSPLSIPWTNTPAYFVPTKRKKSFTIVSPAHRVRSVRAFRGTKDVRRDGIGGH
jgi:hypothetical protein